MQQLLLLLFSRRISFLAQARICKICSLRSVQTGCIPTKGWCGFLSLSDAFQTEAKITGAPPSPPPIIISGVTASL